MTKIVDNMGEKLASVLHDEFYSDEVGEVAIASAYFNVQGYGALKEALGDKPLHLLLGREPTESIRWEEEVLRELEKNEDDTSYFSLLQEAVKYFEDPKREVKTISGRFFHGKCYIGAYPGLMDVKRGVGVVGSSNFTYGGLVSNRELNMVATDREAVKELVDWFHEQWTQASDFKQTFLSFLKNYVTTRSPFEVAAKALYETHKSSIELSELGRNILVSLHPHQQLSVKAATDMLEKYGGVVIADSTGLGKTRVALTLAWDATRRGKNVLLIAPKSVLETTWRDEMRKTNVRLDTLSSEKLSMDPDCALEEFPDADFIIVDEAHYFRNPSTNRYGALRDLIERNRAEVVLATATPVNTSLMDLYWLLSFFLDENAIADVYEGTLKGYFTSNQKKWLQKEPVDMDPVLRKFLVRHSRQFAVAFSQQLKFPRREIDAGPDTKYSANIDYQKIDWTLDKMSFIYYDYSIDRFSEELRMPDGSFVSKAVAKDKREQLKKLVKTVIRINMFKRLESSIEAFRNTLNTLKGYIEKAVRYAEERGYFVPPALHVEPLFDFDEELPLPEELFSKPKYNKKLGRCKLNQEEIERFVDGCKKDINIIENLFFDLPKEDVKFEVFLKKVKKIADNIKEPNGIIVFTQYTTTAKYLYERLRSEGVNPRTIMVTGEDCLDENGSKKDQTELIRSFMQRGGVLVSTDVLSEGQNLQNAQYVVNYDFPWNPVVLIQRVGRVDRLGSPHDTVYLLNILPSEGNRDDPSTLEHFIGLMEKLYSRLEAIRETIGLDSSTLGENAAPKDFSAQEAIARGDKSMLEELAKSLEQFISDPLETLAKIMREKGMDWLKSLPNEIGAYKEGDVDALFVLFTDGKDFYWRLKYYDGSGRETLKSENTILSILLSGEGSNDAENRGQKIDYNTLLDRMKEMKTELEEELERKRMREATVQGAPPRASKTVREIYDALIGLGEEELANRFRNRSAKETLVRSLRQAMKEGILVEKAKELLREEENNETRPEEPGPVMLRRVCWCWVKRERVDISSAAP